jgi:hypothetical protein
MGVKIHPVRRSCLTKSGASRGEGERETKQEKPHL